MYRRPYPYDSSYYFYPPPQEQYYEPVPYQNSNQATPPFYSAPYQTPFEHFSKPNQHTNWQGMVNYQVDNNEFYPQTNKPQTPGSILTQFQNEDGQVDINKMLSTVGQLVHTVQQVSPMIKQFGSIMKNFR